MNDELIFLKTPSGEDAVRNRTRLVQRNLRMVLILVDGLTDVAGLRQKAGDTVMIDAALADLERIGLIKAAATQPGNSDGPVTVPLTVVDSLTHYAEPSGNFSQVEPEETVFADEELAAVEGSGYEPIRAEPTPTESERKSPLNSLTNWWGSAQKRRAQVREERIYEKAYGQDSHTHVGMTEVRIRPPRKKRTKVGRIVAIALLAALALGVLRTLLYPYNEYRPDIEARLSKMLDDEVRIAAVKVSFLPQPMIMLEGVRVGVDAYATADMIRMKLEPRSLLEGLRYREVKVEGLHLRGSGLGRVSRWFQPANMGEVPFDRVEVERMSLDLGWGNLRNLTGTAELDKEHGFVGFVARASQGDFRADVVPQATGFKVSAKASEWTAPLEPPVALAALDFVGTLTAERLVVDKFEARAYDGLISGNGLVAGNMAFKLALRRADAGRLLEGLRAPGLLEGKMSGQVQLANDGSSLNWLNLSTRMEGAVTLTHGSLKRMDFASALRSGAEQASLQRGGDTGFEDLTGKFSMDARSFRISSVRLASGLMLASGQASIARQTGMITGTANVEMRGSASAPRALISISGSASNPELKGGH